MVKARNQKFSYLAYFIARGSFVGYGFYGIFQISRQDSYISAIVGMILGIISLFIILNIVKDEKNIFETNTFYFKKFGYVLNFILTAFAVGFATLIFYNLITFLNLHYLPDTGKFFIGGLVVIALVYVLKKGIHNIANLVLILFYISVIFVIFSIVGSIESPSISNIFPIMPEGPLKPFIGALYFVALSALPIFFILGISKKEVTEKKYKRNIILSYVYGCIGIILTVTIALLIFGPSVATLYKYPAYMLLKKISLFSIVERVENIVSFQFFVDAFILIIVCLYFVMTNLKTYNKKEMYKKSLPYIIPVVIAIIAITGLKDTEIITKFSIEFLPFIMGGIVFTNCILIYIAKGICKIKEKSESRNNMK